jgi:hypothetical protein
MWSDQFGIITFIEDDNEELVGQVPISRILAITNPMENPPWHDGTEVTPEGVAAALRERRFELVPYSADLWRVGRSDWTSPSESTASIAV